MYLSISNYTDWMQNVQLWANNALISCVLHIIIYSKYICQCDSVNAVEFKALVMLSHNLVIIIIVIIIIQYKDIESNDELLLSILSSLSLAAVAVVGNVGLQICRFLSILLFCF